LHGSRVAYVWRWRPSHGAVRDTLQIQNVAGGKPETVASLNESSARLIGPVWRRSQLIFAVRRKNGSRWYRYDASTKRFGSAPGPADVVSFTLGGSKLYWQTGTVRALDNGLCADRGGCGLYSAGVPRFTPARKLSGSDAR
jgi:hypothetical protein